MLLLVLVYQVFLLHQYHYPLSYSVSEELAVYSPPRLQNSPMGSRQWQPSIEAAVAPTSVASMWPWKSMANKIATTPPTLDNTRSTRIGAATADPHVRT